MNEELTDLEKYKHILAVTQYNLTSPLTNSCSAITTHSKACNKTNNSSPAINNSHDNTRITTIQHRNPSSCSRLHCWKLRSSPPWSALWQFFPFYISDSASACLIPCLVHRRSCGGLGVVNTWEKLGEVGVDRRGSLTWITGGDGVSDGVDGFIDGDVTDP